jgi:hypothetical protein
MSRVMSRSMVGMLITMAIIGYIVYTQMRGTSPSGHAASVPRTTIDVAGVKQDLLAMANAERAHFALEGKYASLDDLRAKGNLTIPELRRGDYAYTAEFTDTVFRVIATYSGPPNTGSPRTVSIDQTMQIAME